MVTVTSTVPMPAGEIALIEVVLLTVNEDATLDPKLTAVTPAKFVPVMDTFVAPATGPMLGAIAVTVGGLSEKVKRSAEPVALVPLGVVTVTSTIPLPGGEIALIEVALLTVNEDAAIDPKLTAVAPVKPVPVMVTLVPPAAGPVFGFTPVTDGAAT